MKRNNVFTVPNMCPVFALRLLMFIVLEKEQDFKDISDIFGYFVVFLFHPRCSFNACFIPWGS